MKNNELLECLKKILEVKFENITMTKMEGYFFSALDIVVGEKETFRIAVSKFDKDDNKLISCI